MHAYAWIWMRMHVYASVCMDMHAYAFLWMHTVFCRLASSNKPIDSPPTVILTPPNDNINYVL